jgi:hypothetical protein
MTVKTEMKAMNKWKKASGSATKKTCRKHHIPNRPRSAHPASSKQAKERAHECKSRGSVRSAACCPSRMWCTQLPFPIEEGLD